jgi:hypothetical protein
MGARPPEHHSASGRATRAEAGMKEQVRLVVAGALVLLSLATCVDESPSGLPEQQQSRTGAPAPLAEPAVPPVPTEYPGPQDFPDAAVPGSGATDGGAG